MTVKYPIISIQIELFVHKRLVSRFPCTLEACVKISLHPSSRLSLHKYLFVVEESDENFEHLTQSLEVAWWFLHLQTKIQSKLSFRRTMCTLKTFEPWITSFNIGFMKFSLHLYFYTTFEKYTHFFSWDLLYPVSCTLQPVSCILYPASCILQSTGQVGLVILHV